MPQATADSGSYLQTRQMETASTFFYKAQFIPIWGFHPLESRIRGRRVSVLPLLSYKFPFPQLLATNTSKALSHGPPFAILHINYVPYKVDIIFDTTI